MQNKLKFVLSLLALTVSLSINATIISGSCGDNATYRLEDDGTMHVEGSGDMWNYDPMFEKFSPWYQNSLKIRNVQVAEGITSIGDNAFIYCSFLTSISVPNSVTSIGEGALMGCSSLRSIDIPNSVTSIGVEAFNSCTSLATISIPSSVTSIGKLAFRGCSSLTSIDIPNSVTNIGKMILVGCSSLTSITFPNSVTSIGDDDLYGCVSLTSITIPNSVTSIGDLAFSACYSLKSIIVDSSNSNFSSIDGVLFNKDKSELLIYPAGKTESNYNIPNSVASIGHYAFSNCSYLTSFSIPNSVTSIGYGAFSGCVALKEVYCYAENVPVVLSDEFGSKGGCTLYVPSASIEMYKSEYPWNGFGSILPLADEMLAIDNAIQDTQAINSYSINGTKQSALNKGINIIRMSDGTIRKVYVR